MNGALQHTPFTPSAAPQARCIEAPLDGSGQDSRRLERLEKLIMEHVRRECPGVEWVSGFATLAPHDYANVFRAADVDAAIRVSVLFFAHTGTCTRRSGPPPNGRISRT